MTRRILQAAAGVGGENPYAWDLDYLQIYTPDSSKYDVTQLVQIGVTDALGADYWDATYQGLYIKPDGTKLYMVGMSGDEINEYDISATPWTTGALDISNFVYRFSVASEDITPRSIEFKTDGTKMYMIGTSSDSVHQYSLSTAWDLSTASYDSVSFSVASEEDTPTGLVFKPDGTKMYVFGYTNDRVSEYDLSTAWDISTASFLQDFAMGAQDTQVRTGAFSPDGLNMIMIGTAGDDANQYSLSTAWDVSTLTFIQDAKPSEMTAEGTRTGFFLKPDGTKAYQVGESGDRLAEFAFGSLNLNDATGASLISTGITFKPDGTKMFISNSSGTDYIYEFDLSTAWEPSTATYIQRFAVGQGEGTAHGLAFKPDGTKMYISGATNDAILEYSLSTAWDVSTASYVQQFSISAEEASVTDLYIKPDGTKAYICGFGGDDINEYDLSTAWDISTASYVQTFPFRGGAVAPLGEIQTPRSIFFKPDGTKLYVGDVDEGAAATYGLGHNLTEYTLSTAWDISTASYSTETYPLGKFFGIYFKEDGSRVYACQYPGATTTSHVLEFEFTA